jgi:hypothetical protein
MSISVPVSLLLPELLSVQETFTGISWLIGPPKKIYQGRA